MFDRRQALIAQRHLDRQRALCCRPCFIDTTINALDWALIVQEETFQVFGDFDPAEYKERGQGALGSRSRCLQEWARRTSRYSKEDWSACVVEVRNTRIESGPAPTYAGVSPTDRSWMSPNAPGYRSTPG